MTFVAFQIVRASQLNSEINAFAPFVARRTSDAALTNVTTLTNDTQLFLSGLPASKTFKLESLLGYKGSTTGDFRIQWTCSGSGSSLIWSQEGMDTSQTTTLGADYHGLLAMTDPVGYGAVSPTVSPQRARPGGYLFTGTGSNITLQLQWCQVTADAVNATTVLTGSTISCTLVG